MSLTFKPHPAGGEWAVDEHGHWAGIWFRCDCCGNRVIDRETVTIDSTDKPRRRVCAQCRREGRWKQQTGPTAIGREIPVDIPPDMLGASLDRLSASSRSKLREWPNRTKFIVIHGTCGSGKTSACRALQRELARVGTRVTYLFAPTAKSDWRGLIQGGGESDRLVTTWCRVPLLILDDLNAAQAGDGWVEAIHRVLEERKNNLLPTIVTTSNLAEIGNWYGGAVGSRLSGFEPVGLGSVDHRRRAAQPVNSTPQPIQAVMPEGLSDIGQRIWKKLEEPMLRDELANALELPAHVVASELTLLEMRRVLRVMPGNRVARLAS